MNTDKDLLKIGEFARLANTNLRTLRYYEELDLLQPAGRSEGGFRFYRPADLNRVRMIHSMQELGLHLEQIHDILDTRSPNGSPGGTADGAPVRNRAEWIDKIRTALAEQRRLLDERAQALNIQLELNEAAAKKLEDCVVCPHTPNTKNNFCETCQTTGLTLPEYLSSLF